jgi:hypothetical protein
MAQWITPIEDVVVNEGTQGTRDIAIASGSNETIAYILTPQAGFTLFGGIVTGSGTLRPGVYTVEITAVDADGSAVTSFDYTVLAMNYSNILYGELTPLAA